jgi:hypothetical protein
MITAVGERNINTVRVALSTGDAAVIPWSSRRELLDRLYGPDRLPEIREAFLAVGTSRPVELTDAQKAELVAVINGWASVEDELPDGIGQLRNALRDDLHDKRNQDRR